MRARSRLLCLLIAGVALGGCSGTSLLHGSHGTPPAAVSPAGRAYLSALATEQAELSAAEQRIPRQPQTPAALARSIALLRAAIHELGAGLEGISPPAQVHGLHTRLVKIVRVYEARLRRAEAAAAQPSGVARAASLLLSSTDRASRAFTVTVNRVDRALTQH